MSQQVLPSGLIVASSKSAPAGAPRTVAYDYGQGSAPWGPFPPLWTSGDTTDAFGDHGQTLISSITYDMVYRENSACHAVVNKLVRQIAGTPLRVYRRADDGTRKVVTAKSKDPGSSLAKLLDRPAPRRSRSTLKQWIALPTLIFGNSVLAKYRETPGLPATELVPVDWRFITPYAQKGGSVELWRTDQLSEPRYIDIEETLHFSWEGLGAIGVSPLQPLVSAINLEEAAGRWLMAAFKNAARPSSVVTLPQGANPNAEQLDRMRKSIEGMHKGFDNTFKTALLAPGATWQSIGFNMQEAELMAVRQFSREEFCMVYDVKPGQVGAIQTPGAGYSSVVEINRDLYRTTLPPWFTLIEDVVQAHLIDPEPVWEGLEVEFDTNQKIKGEPEAVAAQIASEVTHGTMTPNEGRDMQGRDRDPNPAADELYIEANNLRPIGEPAAAPEPGMAPALPPAQVAERVTLTSPAPPEDIPKPADTKQPPAQP